ncbi:uncharacterized protein PgNI_12012 [Pyricularia grisea]|uniref:Zn(2)-C6 fungal-type domain-containing protein n=1 Tax=Pyricularia grisea TaxID=148305 RepID=A0A6P8AQR8_PYRGI|nr:uncharacterized protein PgNI_12012 [Pyricularia grisea]TLD04407.1 hypothetical protein PgNI_12012 [Pyricularia grisea]
MTTLEEQGAGLVKRHPACAACNRSKRRCSRQSPTCRRCRVQNLVCVYPAAVPPDRLPHSPQSLTQSAAESPSDLSAGEHARLNAGDSSFFVPHPAATVDQLSGENPNYDAASWFLNQSSWEIDHVHIGEDNRITYPDSGLECFLNQLRLWLDQWTRENHCPFVHPRLYGADISSHLQHALAAWQVYRAAASPTSRRIALRMATDWSGNLIRETSLAENLLGAAAIPNLMEQLARVQALLVFQVIGLFDGDVRARAHSEAILSTLATWADALLQTAATEVATNALDPDPTMLLNQPSITQLRSDGTPSSAWRAWILSESIRRVWIVAALTEAAFLIMKQGFATCPGSIGFTGRSGIWEASSPAEWIANLTRQSRTRHPVFCRGLDRLLEEAGPSDVDEFTKALLAYGRGAEVLADWMSFG